MEKNPYQFKHFILADDDPDDCMFFKDAFVEVLPRTSLTSFVNGNLLMEYLFKTDGPLKGYLIFLDLNMPGKNGMECLREIKGGWPELPVVIYTTLADKEQIEKAQKLGANLFAVKPTSFHGIKDMLEKVLTFNWTYYKHRTPRDKFLLHEQEAASL